MRYFIDIDGVIRNFAKSIRRHESMENLTMDKWQLLPSDLWKDIDKRPEFYLYECEFYNNMIKYIDSELGLENCVFLTNQCGIKEREYWTAKFIEKVFGKGQLVLFTRNFQEKVDILNNNSEFILYDDFPNFYEKEGFEEIKDRIILVDRPWNRQFQDKYNNILILDEETQ